VGTSGENKCQLKIASQREEKGKHVAPQKRSKSLKKIEFGESALTTYVRPGGVVYWSSSLPAEQKIVGSNPARV
jgi:hypothetical protein